MAEKALRKLEEQLSCAICLDTYVDPKILQCFHVYCKECLIKLVVRNQQGQVSLVCPTCRRATPIPPNGVAGLQSAFHINRLLEIHDSLKKAEDTVPEVRSDVTRASNCSEHTRMKQELFCETCEILICLKCVIKGGKHHDHDCYQLNEAFERYQKEMTLSLKPMEEKVANIATAVSTLDKCCEEVSHQEETIKANIDDAIQQLCDVLKSRKSELTNKLHKMTQRKLDSLANQRGQMKNVQDQLNGCINFVKEGIKNGIREEVLKKKTDISKQVKELNTAFPLDWHALEPATKADMIFTPSPDAEVSCQNYGKVYRSSCPDPDKCYTKGKGFENAVVGLNSVVDMFAINSEGEPYTKPLASLECELISQITGATAQVSSERKEPNQYMISYQPVLKGKHHLSIKVDQHHIMGSPFPVTVKLPVEKLCEPIVTIGDVKKPWGVAVNHSGEVVITEWAKNCISIFNPSGKKLRSFGTRGSDHGQFVNPRGVAVDGEGNILVVDTQRIQKFSHSLETIECPLSVEDSELQFKYPKDVMYNPTNNKVYVVDGNHVHVLNSDLTFFDTLSKEDFASNLFSSLGFHGKGQFSRPWGIACDSIGNVFVADSGNDRIQVFSPEGRFLRTFGRSGQDRGELAFPARIAIDANDVVFVSETGNHRVSVFTREGMFVTSFGREGRNLGQFDDPCGLAVDNSGMVYVCDTNNDRIQVF